MAEYQNVQQLVDDINSVMQINTMGDIEADEVKKILIGITELFVVVGTTAMILSGTGAPASNLGNNGDIYIDTAALYFYGPKTNGSWGAGVPIAGEPGAAGKSVLNGSGVPSNGLGVVGDFYIDTASAEYNIYGPKTSTWGTPVALVGPPNPNADLLNGQNGEYYLNRANHTGTQSPDSIVENSSKQFVSAAQKTTWDAKQNALGFTPENTANKGVAGGYTPLGGDLKVPSIYLPSYVDDVLEFANLAAFPPTGETGKLYLALDTNLVYRWTGSVYVKVADGAVQSVNGDTGIVVLNKVSIGLPNVDDTSDANKPVSNATQVALNAKENTLPTGTALQYFRGDKALSTFPKYEVLASLPGDLSGYPDGSLIVITD